ncbi:nucleotidyltransferase family protein [Chromobacterium paludis]|nr:nucleotidyltransferase family protein [Chromobacterium paludis]
MTPAQRPAPPTREADEARLRAMILGTPWLMAALHAARQLELDAWCIGAGAVRNAVWDHLHGYHQPSALADIDVAYFDPACLEQAQDDALQARLQAIAPDAPWEVSNQAAVHLWFGAYFGHEVPPLRSLEEAVASWPEYATAVGVRLDKDDALRIIAPHGLDDLLAMRIRRNPARVSLETYRARIAQKRYALRWPRVTINQE